MLTLLNGFEVKVGSPDNQNEFKSDGAVSDFTQANCDKSSPWIVNELPGFVAGDTWPCSYAGTLPGNADGSI